MSTVVEIETALRELPLQDAQEISWWLQQYLERQCDGTTTSANRVPVRLPDYAARTRMIVGAKILPNMVLQGRGQERW